MLTICGIFDLLFFFFFLGQLCLLLRISYKKRTASSYVIQFIMLPCIECSQSFKTLRELRRHERCHLRKLHCGECDLPARRRRQLILPRYIDDPLRHRQSGPHLTDQMTAGKSDCQRELTILGRGGSQSSLHGWRQLLGVK